MSPRNKLRIAKLCLVLATVPIIVHAYETGPPWGYTAAPGDNKTACSSSGCHTGTPNTASGSVKIILPSGNTGTYVPGQTMQIQVQITDSTKRAYGFEMTARLASNLATAQAGDFNPTDANTQVICADGSTKTGSACPSQFPVEDIEHSFAGYSASINSTGTFTYAMNWTPPASASAGNVTLYVAANCGIGNPPLVSPTNIYTSNLTLTPAAASSAPAISSVQNGATFQSTLAANTYVTVKGQGLSTDTVGRIWTGADFTSNSNGTLTMPTSLDGTSVTVAGTAAYLYYVSPTQINIITPNITAAGSGIPVVVNLNGQASAIFPVTLQSLAPGFFAYYPGTADDGKYLVAVHAANPTVDVGKVGLYPTAPNLTTPAKPGETITLYGTGFGPTSPPITPGIVTDARYDLSPIPTATLGNITAQVLFAGLAPGEGQVYQFNVVVPLSAPDGDLPLVVNVNGTLSAPGMITIHH